ncbi:YfgM family protein [Neisseria wadsworthii]|uniref:Ancillary SecYEG translocon subunit n=1 Tax=Neisseria wadsworthii 9715 TaxID=1030841 RepID=G4CRZ5_9NEIS|nr:tetratricopeptide repeat protein [Neisseria wadsworthii]EGZ44909.1 tetratricopeptide repeat protein [Neisseria wadsworthii 9715]QMT35513.1 tetratricopeptide repeat protein [Neisseria wadsworthii]
MAAHLEEQQELENFKHFWKGWGRWIFALLVACSLAYLGLVLYKNYQAGKNEEAAEILSQMASKAQTSKDPKILHVDLLNLQQNYPKTIAAAQATFMAAAAEFDKGNYDAATKHLNWVLKNQKASLVQALAAQRLATVQLQQQKFDEALATLNTPVDEAFQPVLLELKGDVLVAQGKGKEAVAAYEDALNKLPKEAAARELLQFKLDQLK